MVRSPVEVEGEKRQEVATLLKLQAQLRYVASIKGEQKAVRSDVFSAVAALKNELALEMDSVSPAHPPWHTDMCTCALPSHAPRFSAERGQVAARCVLLSMRCKLSSLV